MSASYADIHLRLTHEQLRICNYNMNPGEVIKIVAFAGMLQKAQCLDCTDCNTEIIANSSMYECFVFSQMEYVAKSKWVVS